ncbi:MAG: hypothetical protein WAW37_06080 [Syntrophobacteraceae bacterium]
MAELRKKELKREPGPPAEEKRDRLDADTPAVDRRRVTSEAAAEADADAGEAPGQPEHPWDAPDPEAAEPVAGRGRTRKVLLVAIPALSLALIASGLFYFNFDGARNFIGNAAARLEPVSSLTRPVPIPDYREMLDFLVLNESEEQKTITSFRLEFAFHSPSRYQNFKERNVVFRDTVYSFLQQQNATRNTSRNWQTLVEKDLLDYIRVTLPQSRSDAIRLTQVENL